MLLLAKDLEIFHLDLTRHAKERKDRSSIFFHFFLAAVRALSLSTSKLRAAKEAFPFFCRYGIAMTSSMVAVPRQTSVPAWIQHAFFCLTVLAAVVDARRTVDLFSQVDHIVGDGNHRST